MADIILKQVEQLPNSAKLRHRDMGDGTHAEVFYVVTTPDDDVSLDAFGRRRVSNPENRADIEFIYDKQPELVDEVINGSATATHNANARDVTLAIVNTTNATSAALYGYDVPYTPGNGQLVEITGTLDGAAIGGGAAFFFVRSTVTGSTVEAVYPQAEWDNPVSDMNWAYSQILAMDFQSLKVGRIRFGFVRDGVGVSTLEVFNDNLRSTGYWQNPSLPFYWRIFNDTTYTYAEMGYGDTANAIGLRYRLPVNANATMRAICATVKSEGGQSILNMPGFSRAIDNALTPKTVSTTLIPILSIRPAATFPTAGALVNRGLYLPTSFTITGDNPIRYELLFRPTLTNPSWASVNATRSGMEVDVTASAVTGGTVVYSDYLSTGNNARDSVTNLLSRVIMKLGRTGTSDILTLAAIRTGSSNSTSFGALHWKEIR